MSAPEHQTDDHAGAPHATAGGFDHSVTRYQPDIGALTSAPIHLVIAADIESADTLTGRTSVTLADLLGLPLTIFPSHHCGFLGGEHGQTGKPNALAATLHAVLDTA